MSRTGSALVAGVGASVQHGRRCVDAALGHGSGAR
uniref:Uncharacterized protein n=1 Tax=Arundo donax TaxID=35708 RepID=A0A0A8Y7E9_ARUDO